MVNFIGNEYKINSVLNVYVLKDNHANTELAMNLTDNFNKK
jgi:hypothetical protein